MMKDDEWDMGAIHAHGQAMINVLLDGPKQPAIVGAVTV
jgi:hypothetical protein